MAARMTKPRVKAIACDCCGQEVPVDASTAGEARKRLQFYEGYSNVEDPDWARVPLGSQWHPITQWAGVKLVDLCGDCYIEQDRERKRLQALGGEFHMDLWDAVWKAPPDRRQHVADEWCDKVGVERRPLSDYVLHYEMAR